MQLEDHKNLHFWVHYVPWSRRRDWRVASLSQEPRREILAICRMLMPYRWFPRPLRENVARKREIFL